RAQDRATYHLQFRREPAQHPRLSIRSRQEVQRCGPHFRAQYRSVSEVGERLRQSRRGVFERRREGAGDYELSKSAGAEPEEPQSRGGASEIERTCKKGSAVTRRTNARLAGFMFLFYIANGITLMILQGRIMGGGGIAAKL